ncbi:MAG: 50S ribosomal protein L24 [Patescibacteria group bacterium]
MKIRKGDSVQLLSGNKKGNISKVSKVLPARNRIFVDGVGLYKKAVKGSGMVDRQKAIDVSIVKLICPKCTKPTRVGITINEKGIKERSCKKCNSII